MADYEVKAPPNLRSVDCCATCKNAAAIGPEEVACRQFRRTGHGVDYYTIVPAKNICDAFEREVRK